MTRYLNMESGKERMRGALVKHSLKWQTGTRIALTTMLASLVISAAIGIIIVLKGDFGDTEGRLLGTTLSLAVFTVLAIPSTVQLGRGKFPILSRFGMGTSVVAFFLIVAAIWSDGTFESVLLTKFMVTFGVTAFASNHTALLLLVSRATTLIRITLIPTIIVLVIIAVMLIISVWVENMPNELARSLTALAILDVLGSLAVPMLSKLKRLSGA